MNVTMNLAMDYLFLLNL